MVGKSALLVGASGLVGGELLNCLLTSSEYSLPVAAETAEEKGTDGV